MDILDYITKNSLILIPVLYVLGAFIKAIPHIACWTIPFILLIIGIALSVMINGVNVDSAIQGILVTGATVLGHQMVKQGRERGN